MSADLREPLSPEHLHYRDSARRFVAAHIVPHRERWEEQHRPDRSLFEKAGTLGVFGFGAPEEFGGAGFTDFRFNAIFSECLAEQDALAAGLCLSMQADIAMPYLVHSTSDEQRARWLPGAIAGTSIVAIAMTEPGGGSDVGAVQTSAVRDGDDYVVNGSKTFITNAGNADLIVTAVRTGPGKHLSLLAVPGSAPGLTKGGPLPKVGQSGADTCEIFFEDVRVPVADRLGEEGGGLRIIKRHLTQERLIVAVHGLAQAERAFQLALEHARERRAFGRSIGAFQHNKFVLAEIKTELDIARAYLERLIPQHTSGRLDHIDAAQAKWWMTELCKRVVDRAVQLFGGYGYMREYPVARAWVDSRVQTIYAGTTEILKDMIGTSLGLREDPRG
ncbi:acyl-CoA dehydrogenase family protein [Actinomadura rugatobispora]|uniref:Acyl-[acyl-carrier-protein] dehydrogenase MbtN n=1 Tax=Actinomadura rugatobispora TaxID=1994 RepID=A0ABW0ZZZ3_9ACTN|nr:acyl-CoA dehydrogenase family protein [Actinomadura rugatobispora]